MEAGEQERGEVGEGRMVCVVGWWGEGWWLWCGFGKSKWLKRRGEHRRKQGQRIRDEVNRKTVVIGK